MVREMAYRMAKEAPVVVQAGLWAFTRAWLSIPKAVRPGGTPGRGLATACHYRVPARARLVNGLRVVVPWNDDGGRAIYDRGVYEPDTVKLFSEMCKPGMTVVDVGASIGQYTLTAAERVGQDGQVHAFECDPETFQWLERNASLNRLRNCRLNTLALSDSEGRATLHLASTRDTGSNSLVGAAWTDSGRTVSVVTMTLDGYLSWRKVERVDVLKIDVEGAEMAVLKGAEKLLTGPNPPRIIIEFEPERQRVAGTSCVDLALHLTDRGYRLQAIGRQLTPFFPEQADRSTDKSLSFNVLAVPIR